MSSARVAIAMLAVFVVACRAKAAAIDPPDAFVAINEDAQAITEEEDAGAVVGNTAPDAADDFEEPAFSACNAPSVKLLRAYDDSRTLAGLSHCLPDGGTEAGAYMPGFDGGYAERIAIEQPVSMNCGHPGFDVKPDIPRIIDSALPFDSATVSHVRAVFASGKARGRRQDVFGIVGDSISIDYNFMKPFSWTANVRVALDPKVRAAISIDGNSRTVIDFFRGLEPPDTGEASTYFDSFWTTKAARIGATAKWVVTADGPKLSPLEELISELSPAYAIVMYGTNDAESFLLAPDKVAQRFGADLRKVVDVLEDNAIIPVLTTIPKHMHDKRFVDCTSEYDAMSNARFMIQTNAVSAEVASIACERHLPLIDFRYAIDPLLNHGVAGDGVHPTVYSPIGGGMLDENGLQCGFNVRNAVTLRMLKMLYDTVQPRASKRQ
jgi:hypothetical protein